jgi:hypothetical protein
LAWVRCSTGSSTNDSDLPIYVELECGGPDMLETIYNPLIKPLNAIIGRWTLNREKVLETENELRVYDEQSEKLRLEHEQETRALALFKEEFDKYP